MISGIIDKLKEAEFHAEISPELTRQDQAHFVAQIRRIRLDLSNLKNHRPWPAPVSEHARQAMIQGDSAAVHFLKGPAQ